jgi:hypothetical protein
VHELAEQLPHLGVARVVHADDALVDADRDVQRVGHLGVVHVELTDLVGQQG